MSPQVSCSSSIAKTLALDVSARPRRMSAAEKLGSRAMHAQAIERAHAIRTGRVQIDPNGFVVVRSIGSPTSTAKSSPRPQRDRESPCAR